MDFCPSIFREDRGCYFLEVKKPICAYCINFQNKPTILKNAHQKRTSASTGRGPKNIWIYLAFWISWDYNTVTRRTKAGRGGRQSPTPLCGSLNLPHNSITAPASLYRTFCDFTRPGLGFVSDMRCGILCPAPLLFVSTVSPKKARGGRAMSHPHGPDR